MLVAGWADGYRNNSFRTIEALQRRRDAVPAARRPLGARRPDDRDARTADRPRRRDGRLVRHLAAQRRRRSRGPGRRLRAQLHPPRARPRPARRLLDRRGRRRSPSTAPDRLDGPRTLARRPRRRHGGLDRLRRPPPVGAVRRPARRRRPLADLGVAGRRADAHRPPRGPAAGQRHRAAREPQRQALRRLPRRHLRAGHPRARSTSASATACTHAPRRLTPGEEYDVEVDARRLRLPVRTGPDAAAHVAGADWPNTVAPPAPLELTVHGGELLPAGERTASRSDPGFTSGAPSTPSEDPAGVDWTVTDDVLRSTTTCSVRHGADYATPHDGHAWEQYAGEVVVDRRTLRPARRRRLHLPAHLAGLDVRVSSTMQVELTATVSTSASTSRRTTGTSRSRDASGPSGSP